MLVMLVGVGCDLGLGYCIEGWHDRLVPSYSVAMGNSTPRLLCDQQFLLDRTL